MRSLYEIRKFIEELENLLTSQRNLVTLSFMERSELKTYPKISGGNYGLFATILKSNGFLNPSDREVWYEIDIENARKALNALFEYDMAYRNRMMNDGQAKYYTETLLRILDEPQYFVLGTRFDDMPIFDLTGRLITELPSGVNTFSYFFIALSNDHVIFLYVGDED